MYHFNHQPENWATEEYAPRKRAEKQRDRWGGGRARRLLGAAYTIAFLCLLRFDEVLKIQMHDIKVLAPETSISLTLPFRKTDQHGGACPLDPCG